MKQMFVIQCDITPGLPHDSCSVSQTRACFGFHPQSCLVSDALTQTSPRPRSLHACCFCLLFTALFFLHQWAASGKIQSKMEELMQGWDQHPQHRKRTHTEHPSGHGMWCFKWIHTYRTGPRRTWTQYALNIIQKNNRSKGRKLKMNIKQPCSLE